MRDQEWDSTLAKLNALDLSELVLGLLSLDTVDGEASLGVVDKAEVLASLLDGDDIHEASWVGGIGADLSVDLDQALHDDGLGLASVKSILQAVTDEDDQWHAVAELVWTWGWARRIGTGQFVQEPVGWRAKALLVLLSEETLVFVSRLCLQPESVRSGIFEVASMLKEIQLRLRCFVLEKSCISLIVTLLLLH